jgi:hypothetical protein
VNPSVFSSTDELARQHSFDIADTLQLITVLNGRYSVLGPNSAWVLITADANLATAALSQGVRVWNCRTSEEPPWAV